MKKLKSGLVEALSSTIIGLALIAAVSFCADKGWIPAYSTIILSVINIIASIISIRKMRKWGIFYACGWLAGAFIFNALGLFDNWDIFFNIAVPIIILVLRFILWVSKPFAKASSRAR